jgi:two-component system OmpR family response regulator
MKLLLVEDDREAAGYLKRALSEAGHAVHHASGGRDGLMLAAVEPYDVIILDRMLPEVDGLSILRTIRASGVKTPVLLLTAMGGIDDRVEGLDAGGDDYLVKPFAFAELMARVRALVRRGNHERPAQLEAAGLTLDPATRRVMRGDSEIDLSAKEFALLETFMRRPGDVLSRMYLLEQVWDYDYEHRSNVVDVYVRYLREKIDRPFGTASIDTVRGAGYRLCESARD